MPSKPKKIAYFIAYPQRMAGANRSLMELVLNLPKSIKPEVVIVEEGLVADAYREVGIEPHILRPGKSLSQFGKASLNWSRLKRAHVTLTQLAPYTMMFRTWLKEQHIDLVHVNDPRGAILVGPATKSLRIPLIGHLRGSKAVGGMYWEAFERLCDRIITVCDAIRSDLSKVALPKAVTVYNGTRCEYPVARSMPWLSSLRAQGIVVVSCFASITPFKGIHHLLRATALLNATGRSNQFVVLCIGDIPTHDATYFQWLLDEALRLSVDNWTFVGWQSEPFTFYKYTDVSVLPTAANEFLRFAGKYTKIAGNEGFPRTHLEAMCYSIPTIGTRLAGVPEQIVHGETGLVVEPSDPLALAEALDALVTSASQRREMGSAGHRRVRGVFSTRAYVAGVLKVYEELLGASLSTVVSSPPDCGCGAAPA